MRNRASALTGDAGREWPPALASGLRLVALVVEPGRSDVRLLEMGVDVELVPLPLATGDASSKLGVRGCGVRRGDPYKSECMLFAFTISPGLEPQYSSARNCGCDGMGLGEQS